MLSSQQGSDDVTRRGGRVSGVSVQLAHLGELLHRQNRQGRPWLQGEMSAL